ncbi:hypothetical protein [Zavarzinia aquatilis]|uniref:Uncharacterized protein n=1 Tax=Zavarzinia aquatilis TaxID=2211142 RepID=A0A317EKM5_9PROT|nr:hypothetical protein [Zavarzinia aquatilis]PWR25993.1 hypothetical protein DKG74_03330 [Zavarzinia aquatilis]
MHRLLTLANFEGKLYRGLMMVKETTSGRFLYEQALTEWQEVGASGIGYRAASTPAEVSSLITPAPEVNLRSLASDVKINFSRGTPPSL